MPPEEPKMPKSLADITGPFKGLSPSDPIVLVADAVQALRIDVTEVKNAIGSPSRPGEYAGDPPQPGTGLRGTMERLARAEESRSKAHRGAAAKTGALTAGVLAVVLKLGEMMLSAKYNPPPPPPPPHSATLAPHGETP